MDMTYQYFSLSASVATACKEATHSARGTQSDPLENKKHIFYCCVRGLASGRSVVQQVHAHTAAAEMSSTKADPKNQAEERVEDGSEDDDEEVSSEDSDVGEGAFREGSHPLGWHAHAAWRG
eukprot:1159435-Pelagomonas_calceolata.AAC.10